MLSSRSESWFDVESIGTEAQDGEDEGDDAGVDDVENGQEQGDEEDDDRSEAVTSSRERRFVIDDSPELGPAFFVATRRVKPKGDTVAQTVYAIAVRERGDQHNANVLRLAYCVAGED